MHNILTIMFSYQISTNALDFILLPINKTSDCSIQDACQLLHQLVAWCWNARNNLQIHQDCNILAALQSYATTTVKLDI